MSITATQRTDKTTRAGNQKPVTAAGAAFLESLIVWLRVP